MFRRILLLLVAVTLSAGLVSSAAAGPSAEVVAVVEGPQGLRTETFLVPSTRFGSELARIRALPGVLAAGTAHERGLPAAVTSTSSLLPEGDWGYRRLGGSALTDLGTGSGVIVAVLDTGVDATHPEFGARVLPGKDFVDPTGDARIDPNGHGTHVAGIIAAAADGSGVTGVAPDARILPVRVLAENGIGDDAWLALGIVWAVDNGAHVLNLSVGGAVPSTLLEDAIVYALDHGALVVISSGNDGAFKNEPSYPAAYPSAFAVGATDASDRRSMFSNTGSYLDMAAPGSWIRSTWPGGRYQMLSGTSMAAPFVAGSAALLQEATGTRGRELAALLSSHAIDLSPIGRDELFGAGLVNPLGFKGVVPAPVQQPSAPLMPQLPQLSPPALPQLPAPTLPQLPSLAPPQLPPAPGFPALPVPPRPDVPPPASRPIPPTIPSPTIPSPVPPSLAPPSKPSRSSPAFTLTVSLKVLRSGSGRVLEVRLAGPAPLLARRDVQVLNAGRTITVRTDWKGYARIKVGIGSVEVSVPGGGLHAPLRGSTRVD